MAFWGSLESKTLPQPGDPSGLPLAAEAQPAPVIVYVDVNIGNYYEEERGGDSQSTGSGPPKQETR